MNTADLLKKQIKVVIDLYSNGQIQEALDSVETLIKDHPKEPLLFNLKGVCYKAIGRLDAAVKNFEMALIIKPDYIEVCFNLGVTLRELGQLNAAVDSYKKALNLKPDYTEAHYNLGNTYKELGQLEDAVKSYEKALSFKPDHANVHNNLGNALSDLGQLDDAVESYKKAVAVKPNFADAHNNLGLVFMELGQLDAAVKCYEKALTLKPDYAEVQINLGNALSNLGQLDNAVESYKNAVALKPNYALAHVNLGRLMLRLNRMDEALEFFEHAIVLNPDLDYILGDLLHTKMHLCLWDDLENHLNELTNKVIIGEKVLKPFPLLGLIDNPEIQRKTSEIYSKDKYPQNHLLPKIGHYPKDKKIRIGYFSADFHNHATMHLMAELFECHDKCSFELIAFSFGADNRDKWRQRVVLCFDQFLDVSLKSDQEVLLLARKMKIDIAVDLKGYTQDCRTGIFAMSAAPIQVNYLGYPGTMAADYMDYLVADQTIIPKENQKYYSEKIVYMPHSYQVNTSIIDAPKTLLSRQEIGLPKTGFIFCCFNNNYKITPTTFTGWMRILKAVEDSVLWLFESSNISIKNLKKEAIKFGINENRLVFAKFLPIEEHLTRIQHADLFIDTLPYNAHTTTSDALRMGLPVLTCIGRSFASRVAASLLNAVNLPELITTNQEQYESLAIELATNPEKLKIIKDKLVNNLATAPLYDTPLFTRHLESAYMEMYDRYQNGLEPEHIYVEH